MLDTRCLEHHRGSCRPPVLGTDTAPTHSLTYPLAVRGRLHAPERRRAVQRRRSAPDMGKFTVTPTVGVSVPQNSFAGTYTSTLTLGDGLRP